MAKYSSQEIAFLSTRKRGGWICTILLSGLRTVESAMCASQQEAEENAAQLFFELSDDPADCSRDLLKVRWMIGSVRDKLLSIGKENGSFASHRNEIVDLSTRVVATVMDLENVIVKCTKINS